MLQLTFLLQSYFSLGICEWILKMPSAVCPGQKKNKRDALRSTTPVPFSMLLGVVKVEEGRSGDFQVEDLIEKNPPKKAKGLRNTKRWGERFVGGFTFPQNGKSTFVPRLGSREVFLWWVSVFTIMYSDMKKLLFFCSCFFVEFLQNGCFRK